MDFFGIYKKLFKLYGPQGWWPLLIKNLEYKKENSQKIKVVYGISYNQLSKYYTKFRDPYFEIALGAILTQNTAWVNVTKALINLYSAHTLTPKQILKLDHFRLQKLIRPAGYFRQKAKKIKLFCQWLVDECDGDLLELKKYPTKKIREKLLAQWGIGRETADSIILYALNRPIFVIDTYTKRFCAECGIIYKNYDDYRILFESSLGRNTKIFQEYHAIFVASGKDNHKRIKN